MLPSQLVRITVYTFDARVSLGAVLAGNQAVFSCSGKAYRHGEHCLDPCHEAGRREACVQIPGK